MSTTFTINLREQEKAAHFAYILLQKKQDLGKEFERSFNMKFGLNSGGVLTFTTHEHNEENVRNGFNTLLQQFTSGTHMTRQHISDAATKSRNGNGYRSNDNSVRGHFGEQAQHKPYKFEAKNEGQTQLLDVIAKNDITFGLGPAGTGKTHVAVVKAVEMFNKGEVKRILLARPAQEAGEKLGYLPGDQKQKLDPYMRPLYDEMTKVMGKATMDKLMSAGTIEIVPVGLMRGRTFEDAFIIVDEAQNCTREQTKMALTRLGNGSKMVFTGDPNQTDIIADSGLAWAAGKLEGVEGIGHVKLSKVVRHPTVQRVVDALEGPSEEPVAKLDKPKQPAQKPKTPGQN